VAIDPAGNRNEGNPRHWAVSPGLALVAAALLVVVVAPPLETLARRYLFIESIQFSVLAMVGPAPMVVGAPWRLGRLSGGRPAAARTGRHSFAWAAGLLGAWVGVCLLWRLPPVLDGLARHPALLAAELVTLLPAGALLWLELVNSRPFVARLAGPRRAAFAAVAMWSIWAIAYVLGFAGGSVVHAYDGAGSSLATVADQEITAGLLWFVAACCFLPVIFASVFGWLKDSADPGEELASLGATSPGVRGWGRPRQRSRS
jgi:cytochrome c oxidase assembly factor CtaG